LLACHYWWLSGIDIIVSAGVLELQSLIVSWELDTLGKGGHVVVGFLILGLSFGNRSQLTYGLGFRCKNL
jgi:hypothetical protein